MLNCQTCDQPATHHVTEIIAGKPVEYHLCQTHLQDLEHLAPAPNPGTPFQALRSDPAVGEALSDPAIWQEMAAHLLPALCLALLHEKPAMRIAAIYRLIQFGSYARSAAGALRDAIRDPDEHVAKAARTALDYIESDQAKRVWF
jgi:hypothetical protein